MYSFKDVTLFRVAGMDFVALRREMLWDCGPWNVKCGVWIGERGVESVKCGVGSVKFGAWSGGCEV